MAGLPARLLVRRQPGTGQLLWVVLLDAAADLGDPLLPGQVDDAIAAFRAQTGL